MFAIVASVPANARAQVLPATPDTTEVATRFGPFWLNPSLALSDAGIDTNLFNDDVTEEPNRDFTLTLAPQTDVWMRLGRTWATGSARQELIWFRQNSDQRAANGRYVVGWIVPLTRLSVAVNGSWLQAKERPSFEIDTRADRREAALSGAAEYRLRSRTLVGARVERRRIQFSSRSAFERLNLDERLSRARTAGALTLRHELTPLTSVTADFSAYRDRFALSPSRDSSSVQGALGVRFDPSALIRGGAQVGYRRFTPTSPDTPAYTGATVSANVSVVTPLSTKLTMEVARDVEYSFESEQPYYLFSGFGVSGAQRVFGRLDAIGSVGIRSLSYRHVLATVVPPLARRDRVLTYGGGPSYRLGLRMRMWFEIERHQRTSQVADRSYRGLRYSVTMMYGTPSRLADK